MKTLPSLLLSLLMVCSAALAQVDKPLPKALEDWKDWALWDDAAGDVPRIFNDTQQLLSLWAEPLDLQAGAQGGSFSIKVTAYRDQWMALPGDADSWPQEVTSGGVVVAVLNRDGVPHVLVKKGATEIKGSFQWTEMPQKIALPQKVGVLRLQLNGQPVELPVWDAEGQLWLKRTSTETADKDFLALEVYRALEDGSPQWLRTQLDVTVAGKSREEVLGHALPEGWILSSVESALPCAVDEAGLLKLQVRAGKWVVMVSAFRTTPAETVGYAEGMKPLVAEELVGLKNEAGFRVVEISGLSAVDVAQTRYPQAWRQLPVYQWPTAQAFQVTQNMRGMGEKKVPGVSIRRRFWLDEDGQNYTYQDEIFGQGQQTWRLDAAAGHLLGAVKIGGQGQLITKNPSTGATGVEVRDRALSLQAVGRLPRSESMPATGWQKDAESLETHVHLPPGWRLLAVWGADWSRGDWLTAWSLYDVFLLLLFALALQKLWGWLAALVGALGFVLTYHELGAPQLSWLLVLAVLGTMKYVREPRVVLWLTWLKAGALLVLAAGAVPFISQQIQQAIYPQLEPYRYTWQEEGDLALRGNNTYTGGRSLDAFSDGTGLSYDQAEPMPAAAPPVMADAPAGEGQQSLVITENRMVQDNVSYLKRGVAMNNGYVDSQSTKGNLFYDKKAKIQTGPAIPNWNWRQVSFGWRGPVTQGEQVSLWLVPCGLTRVISLLRVVMLLGLLWLLLRKRSESGAGSAGAAASTGSGAAVAAMLALLLAVGSGAQAAEIPSNEMLQQLRSRLLAELKDTPQRAEIPRVEMKVAGRKLEMLVEVHHLGSVAVPLPGMLPSWTPVTIERMAEGVAAPCTTVRHNGALWVVPEHASGTAQYRVTGLIPPGAEWQWTSLLKPRQVSITAPDWTVTGVKPNGTPEDQVFFVEKNRSTSAEAAYDQKDFSPVVVVERQLELGLVWQVHTRVQRLSASGKALSLSLPLLTGERVLTTGATVEKGRLAVRMGPGEEVYDWESELQQQDKVKLLAEKSDSWVERWSLSTSPIWNVAHSGLAPVYEDGAATLQPSWTPWPGESVELSISRPEAISGETITVHKAVHDITLGDRQIISTLKLQVQASMGEEFSVQLDPGAEVTSLTLAGQEQAVRRDGDKLLVTLRPGEQELGVQWKLAQVLGTTAKGPLVKLPVASSNISTTVHMPTSRWLLAASGPQRGPAIRFWGMALTAILLGWGLSRQKLSPLSALAWALLLLGFLQLPLVMGGIVVLWFFAMAWRGQNADRVTHPLLFNLLQLILLGASLLTLGVLLAVVHEGLLGRPEMFVTGFGSTTEKMNWFQDRVQGGELTQPSVVSVSIWAYRGIMLLWALWLARYVLRWVPWAWTQLSAGGVWRKMAAAKTAVDKKPPPLPAGGSSEG